MASHGYRARQTGTGSNRFYSPRIDCVYMDTVLRKSIRVANCWLESMRGRDERAAKK